ncbi:MAG: HEPN domain-containing protein [Planctomycetota bacterium]
MPLEPPLVLLGKARDDERLALLVAGNTTVTDEQVGFLAQQGIEKTLKAVLSCHGLAYRRTHDLSELLDALRVGGVAYPPGLDACVSLTPFAAEMRYDYLPPEETPEKRFDRATALRLVRLALEWAEGIVGRHDKQN